MADPEIILRKHLAELKEKAKEYATGKEKKKGFLGFSSKGTDFNKLLDEIKQKIEDALHVWGRKDKNVKLPPKITSDKKFVNLMGYVVRIRDDLDAVDPNNVKEIKEIMLKLLAAFKQM